MLFCPKKWRKVSKTKLSSIAPILMHDAPQEQGYLGVLRGAMREGTDIILLLSMLVGFHLTQIIAGIK